MFLPTHVLRLLDSRPVIDHLTPLEYVFGSLRLIDYMRDSGRNPAPYEAHLRQVICDANTYSWEAVRSWSNEIFEQLDSREIKWDSPQVQIERARVSWSGPLATPNEVVTHLPNPAVGNAAPVPCKMYNALDDNTRCHMQTEHVVNGVLQLHACALCFYGKGMRRTQHTAKSCFTRKALADPKSDINRRPDRNQQNTQYDQRPWTNAGPSKKQHINRKPKN